MSYLDSQQVQLRLTTIPFILDELRRKRRLHKNPINGEETFTIQFDSRQFDFKAGRVVTVGKTVADCLIADATVIVGPSALDGEITPVLEVVNQFILSEGEKTATPTTCLFCNEEQGSVSLLIHHLREEHESDSGAELSTASTHAPARSQKAKKASAGDGDADSE